jgi:glucose/arabinose dehydrogenase
MNQNGNQLVSLEATESIGLHLVADGLNSPVALLSPPDGTRRLFIVDRIGVIWIVSAEGVLSHEPFLDVRHKMVPLREDYDERGLLGLAFHPQYASNGRFFVYYSAPAAADAPVGWDHTSHLSEFRTSRSDPGRADLGSERVLLRVHEPQANHNGGCADFGPDGFLYVSLGDGGAGNDRGLGHPSMGNGQDLTTLLGSILRIDVDHGDPYAIPPDNPFLGQHGRDEIYAYGLRNPFRFSFDAAGDHQLYAGDVGQELWEEVDIVIKGGNYGWNIKEGLHCFDPDDPDHSPDDCPDSGARGEPLIDPVIEYGHPFLPGGIGTCVIGGFVYRGQALPQLQGRYVFGDWTTAGHKRDGLILAASPPAGDDQLWTMKELSVATDDQGRVGAYVLGLGQDANLELYVLTTSRVGPTGSTGRVWKILPGYV